MFIGIGVPITALQRGGAPSLTAPIVAAQDELSGRTLTISVTQLSGRPTPTVALTALTLDSVDVLGDATGTGPWVYVVPSSASVQDVAWTVTATNSEGTDTASGSEVVPADVTLWSLPDHDAAAGANALNVTAWVGVGVAGTSPTRAAATAVGPFTAPQTVTIPSGQAEWHGVRVPVPPAGVGSYDTVSVIVMEDRFMRVSCISTRTGSGGNSPDRPLLRGARGSLVHVFNATETAVVIGQPIERNNETVTVLADELVNYGGTNLRRLVLHRRCKPGFVVAGLDIGPGVVGQSIVIYGGDQQESSRHPLCPYRNVFPAFAPTRLRYVNPAMATSPAEQTITGGVSGVAAALAAAKAGNTAYATISAALSGISGSGSAGCIIVIADGTYTQSSTITLNNTIGTATNPLVIVGETPRGARIVGPVGASGAGRVVNITGTSRHIHFHNLEFEGRGSGGTDPNTFMVDSAGLVNASGGVDRNGRAYGRRINRADITMTGCRIIGSNYDDALKLVNTRGITVVGNILEQSDSADVESVFDSVTAHDVIVAFNDVRGTAQNGIESKGYGNRWVIAYNDIEAFTKDTDAAGLIDLGGGGNAPFDIVWPLGDADVDGTFYGGYDLYAIGNRCVQLNPVGRGIVIKGSWLAHAVANYIETSDATPSATSGDHSLRAVPSSIGLRRDDGTRIMPSSALSITPAADRWTSYYNNMATHYAPLVNYLVLFNRNGIGGAVGGENQTGETTINGSFEAVAGGGGHYVRSFGADFSGNGNNAAQTAAAAWNGRIYPRDGYFRDNRLVRKGSSGAYTPTFNDGQPSFALTDTGAGGSSRHIPIVPSAAIIHSGNTHAANNLPTVGRAAWSDQEVYARLGLA